MSELRTMEADFTKHSMPGIYEDEEINPNAPISPLSPLSPTYSYNTCQQPNLYTILQSSVNASSTMNPIQQLQSSVNASPTVNPSQQLLNVLQSSVNLNHCASVGIANHAMNLR